MSFKVGIASMSLGRARIHQLPEKLYQAAANGFQGIEVFYEDIEYLAKTQSPGQGVSRETLLQTSRTIRELCDKNKLEVICLQPFIFYEGLLDREEHARRIGELKVWFEIVKLLGTDIIQIPSQFLNEGVTGDLDVIVNDLREAADLGLAETPVVRFVYENLAWGRYVDTWEKAYDVVLRVDRPNFGICLDTFNICGRVYADPAAEWGKNGYADEDMKATLARMKQRIDVQKIFYIQIADGEKLRDPLLPGHAFHVDGQPPRMSWSRNARLFAFEEGGYLPVLDVANVIINDLGYKGWVSMELFSRTMAAEDDDVPAEHARRGIESWRKLCEALDMKI